jgi:hypothetical protein
MFVSRCQKAGQRLSIKIAYMSFEDAAKFKYLGTTLTDQNCVHEEMKSRLNSGSACYHSVQSLLSSRLLSRNVKVKIYKTIFLPFVFCGRETWYLTLREEHRLRVFENRVPRRTFESKRDEVTEEWRKLHNEELHNLYSSPGIIRQIKSRRIRWGACDTHARGEKTVQGFGGKSRRKDTIRKTKARWENGIRVDFMEFGLGVVDRI